MFAHSLNVSSIWPIDRTLSSVTTLGQSGPGSNGNGEVFHQLQSWSLTIISWTNSVLFEHSLYLIFFNNFVVNKNLTLINWYYKNKFTKLKKWFNKCIFLYLVLWKFTCFVGKNIENYQRFNDLNIFVFCVDC